IAASLGFQAALAAALAGCTSEHSDDRSPRNAAATRAPSQSAGALDATSSLTRLFHDDMTFTLAELTGGRANCEDVLRREHIANDLIPWPEELRSFLVAELRKLPIVDLILDSVHSIHLVRDHLLQDPGHDVLAAGLACDRGTDYKGVIFLNIDT